MTGIRSPDSPRTLRRSGPNDPPEPGHLASCRCRGATAQPWFLAIASAALSMTVLPMPLDPVMMVRSPGIPEPCRRPYSNSSRSPAGPIRSGGVAPAVGLTGFCTGSPRYSRLLAAVNASVSVSGGVHPATRLGAADLRIGPDLAAGLRGPLVGRSAPDLAGHLAD
jgi:hypothetical protein